MNKYEQLLYLQEEFEKLKNNQKALEKFCINGIPPIRGGQTVAAGFNLRVAGDLYSYDVGPIRIPVGSDFHTLTADSSLAAGLGWATPVIFVTKLADETKNSDDVLGIDTELQITLSIGTYYAVQTIFVNSGATPDFAYTMRPQTGTMTGTYSTGTLGGTAPSSTAAINSGTAITTNGTIQVIKTVARIVVTVAGIFGLAWAQTTSDAGDTIVLAGSNLKIYRA